MTSSRQLYIKYIVVFVFFSFLLALMVSAVNFYTAGLTLSQDVENHANELAKDKVASFNNNLDGIENLLEAVRINKLFHQYLDEPSRENELIVEQLLLSFSEANKRFFQVRYLDEAGQEKIRVERKNNKNVSQIVYSSKLQNKSNRYYFQILKDFPVNAYWYSKLDLNIENGIIEKPLKPTLRVGTPVYHKGAFKGVLIINIAIKKQLNLLKKDREFEISVVDEDGYILMSFFEEKNWSRYLNKNEQLKHLIEGASLDQLRRFGNPEADWFSYPLNVGYNSSEELFLVLKPKESYLTFLGSENLKYTFYLSLLIFLVSLPLAILLANYPARLQNKLNDFLVKKTAALDIVDEYVIKADLDSQGQFVKLSQAFSNNTGYELSDLQNHNISHIMQTQQVDETFFEIENNLKKGMSWRGEIYGNKKNGDEFWFDTSLSPVNQDDSIEYSMIVHDLTKEHIVTKLSQKDALTGLSNRLKLDQELESELVRSQRYKEMFSILLIDIDDFKQVNDEFGHIIGDAVLKGVAQVMKSKIRSVDIIGRWGGEEFMIICPVTDKDSALILARKLLIEVEAKNFKFVGSKTISIGVTDYQNNETLESIVNRADKALYQAKENGKNQAMSL